MPGLLDDPMMSFAMGLLEAGGSSPRPVTLGQALARGYGAAQESEMMSAKRRQMEQHNQMLAAQMAEMQRQQSQRMQQDKALGDLVEQIPESMRPIMRAYPELALKAMLKEPEKPQLVTVQTPQGPMQRWMRPGEAQGVDIGAPADKEAAAPWYVKRGPDGRTVIDPAFADFEKQKAAFARPPAQPMAPVAYIDDKGSTVWGTIREAMGRPAANFNPGLQGQLAGAKEAAKTEAEERTKASLDAPRVIDNAQVALKHSDELLKHPGFKQAVGASSILGVQKIPGTAAKDFMNRLDQLKGGAFLEAFNTLKGGGQITEVEGKKATDAIARMDNATSEGEFVAAVRDYQDVIRKGMNRAKMKANPVGKVQQQLDDPLGLR